MPDSSHFQHDFVKILNGLAGSRRPYAIFRDWLEMAAIAYRQLPYLANELPKDEQFDACEQQYLHIAGQYSSEELTEMAKFNAFVTLALQAKPQDFLGSIYMDQEFGNVRTGQFFTPYHLSKAVAKMNLANAAQLVEQKGIITVNDCACGAGGMIIAAAEELMEQGYDPRSVMQVEAIDIDRDCFNMTYIQLSVLELQAVVRHGNSLSLEMYESRPTMQLLLFNQWLEEQRVRQQTEQCIQVMFALLQEPEKQKPEAIERAPPIDQAADDEQPTSSTEQLAIDFTAEPEAVTEEESLIPPADIVLTPQQLSIFDSNQQLR